jgi:hypothetical protein
VIVVVSNRSHLTDRERRGFEVRMRACPFEPFSA